MKPAAPRPNPTELLLIAHSRAVCSLSRCLEKIEDQAGIIKSESERFYELHEINLMDGLGYHKAERRQRYDHKSENQGVEIIPLSVITVEKMEIGICRIDFTPQ